MASSFISFEKLYTLVSPCSVNYDNIGAFLVMGAYQSLLFVLSCPKKFTKSMVAGAVKG